MYHPAWPTGIRIFSHNSRPGRFVNPIRAIYSIETNPINTLRPIWPIMSILGAAKITYGNKISLITDVRKKLKANVGDVIVFEDTVDGQIVIRKG